MEERNNIIVSCVLIILSLAGLLYSSMIPGNAKTYPMYVLGFIGLLAGLFMIKNINKINQEKKNGKENQDKSPVFTVKEWGVIAISLLYILALKYFGFVIASILVFFGLATYLGYRKWVILFITGISSVAGIWYIFFKFLHLSKITGIFF